MRARLEAVYFGVQPSPFPRLAAVLELSARRHCPGWAVNVRRIDPHGLRAASGTAAEADNHHKLAAWRDVVAKAPEGEQLLLLDVDTFVLGSLDPLWEQPFDVAITVRPAGSRFPFNAGVLAVRVGPAARRFFDSWLAQDAAFLRDAAALRPWRQRFGGMNQASLGAVLEAGVPAALGLQVAELPCAVWNCEDTTWEAFDPEATRIVHVKSALRSDAIERVGNARTARLATRWRALDREAQGAAVPA